MSHLVILLETCSTKYNETQTPKFEVEVHWGILWFSGTAVVVGIFHSGQLILGEEGCCQITSWAPDARNCALKI